MAVDLGEERDCKPPEGVWEKARETWKRELVSLPKDIPSADRKILTRDGRFFRVTGTLDATFGFTTL